MAFAISAVAVLEFAFQFPNISRHLRVERISLHDAPVTDHQRLSPHVNKSESHEDNAESLPASVCSAEKVSVTSQSYAGWHGGGARLSEQPARRGLEGLV